MRSVALPPAPGRAAPGGAAAGSGYRVSTEVYEGPFDLLLHLILREEVEIWDVSLARIVDAFLAEIEHLQSVDLDTTTEFLLVAATLVELKARRLLPGPDDVELDEELGLWEERDVLLSRLLECKTFKDASAVLQQLADRAGRSWPRTAGIEERFHDLTPDLLAGVTPERLRRAYLRAVQPRPVPRVEVEHIAPIRASVRDAVEELADELPRVGTIGFRRLTAGLATRLEVIVRFLAVLELYKQGLVEIEQAATFADIVIAWVGGDGDGDLHRPAGSLVDAYEG